MVKEEKLTPEMWQFYKIIKIYTELNQPRKGINIHDLALNLGYTPISKEIIELITKRYLANTYLYRHFYDLKEAINNSSEVDKIIVMDEDTYRLATEEEAMAYYKKLYDRGIDYLNRASFIKKKINLDNQGKLLNNQYNELTPENKQFHETYAKGDLYEK